MSKKRSSHEFTEEQAREYARYQATQDRGDPPHSPNGRPHADSTTTRYSLDDKGNAQRFADRFGDVYRYDHTAKLWHQWDKIKWREDALNQAQEDAKQIAQDIFAEALAMPHDTEEQTKAQKAVFSWAKSSGMEYHITKLLKLAQSIPRLAVTSEIWNADPVLLGYPNGYLNLKTGEWRSPPWPEAMITKVTGAPRDMSARSEVWERTLSRFLPSEAQRRDFQTATGYCINGRGKEDLFVVYGRTKCGKSTLLNAIRAALGDYAGTIGLETFTTDKYESGGRSREDLVSLVGKRFVLASEATENQRLNPALIKQMLGGSDGKAMRANYGRQFTAKPVFGLWLATNYQPKLPADDEAMWERLHVFEFTAQIPPEDRDQTERDKVIDPTITGSAVLAFLEAGWWRYVREDKGRLKLPTTEKATSGYRAGQDHLAQFIADGCDLGETLWCTFGMFKRVFRRWLEETGAREQYSDTRIGRALTAAGYTEFKHPQLNARCRSGLRIKGLDETPQ